MFASEWLISPPASPTQCTSLFQMLSILGNSACKALTSSTRSKAAFAQHYHTNTGSFALLHLLLALSQRPFYYHMSNTCCCADFDVGLFQMALRTRYIGRQLIYRETVASTMNVASEEVCYCIRDILESTFQPNLRANRLFNRRI